jgi:hypothetical protein
MLALGLSLIVIAAIGVSIDMYLRLFDSSRTNVEESQLARAVLRRMADDIRGTVLYNPVDVSKLVSQVSSSTSGSSGASGTTSGAAGVTGSTSQSSSASTGSTSSPSTTDTSQASGATTDTSATGTTAVDDTTDLSSTGPQTVPGLYGNSTQLQIDVSRLPRLDQYLLSGDQNNASTTTQTAGSTPSDHLSDVKNVVYYVFGDTGSLAMGAGTGMQTGCGLVRRDMDRAAALFSSQSGQDLNLDSAAAVIAPEVESIQFAYYDGTNQVWVDSWDSSQNGNGGLPLAVQITLAIARPAKKGGVVQPPGIYTLLVDIPCASSSSTASTASSDSTSQDTTTPSPTTPSSNTPSPSTQSTSPAKTSSSESSSGPTGPAQNNQTKKSGGK